MPLDAKPEDIESHAAVQRVLGGLYGPYKVEIDEILVRSVWRPNIAVARTWMGPRGRVFLAGDSAHQNIPTGGYGMNMGIGDAFDLGWKLASVVHGSAGSTLLRSYELERRPVALRNVDRSGVHFKVHSGLQELLQGGDPRRVDNDDEEARTLRKRIHEYYQANDGENKDFGVEMGYRYTSPVILRRDDDGPEPEFAPRHYSPTTWPGSRAPHLYLSTGQAIFDTFGKYWTLVVFSPDEVGQNHLVEAAQARHLQLAQVSMSREDEAKRLYERNLVLIRPDHHVAWRADQVASRTEAEQVIRTVAGWLDVNGEPAFAEHSGKPSTAFTSSEGISTQTNEFALEKMGEFQT